MRALSGLGYRPRAPVAAETFADEAARESQARRPRDLEDIETLRALEEHGEGEA
jgi:hypothetical protein